MAKHATIRVVVIDDHPAVRASVQSCASDADGLTVVGEASCVAGALPLIGKLQPDVVVLDMTMPEVDGIAGARALRRHFPQLRLLVLTGLGDACHERQARDAGATGYVSKQSTGYDLAATIRALESA
jgi:DNA-binding NarL/FixJ family response regulator